MLRVMDLFSGIGAFSYGLKCAGGFKTVAYCEIEPYCQQVLQARMREGKLDTAPICSNIRYLDGEPWAGGVDLICGGFPCQDVSVAGAKVGLDGERSGLWREMGRLIREVRPRYVIVENVPGLLDRGIGDVLGELAEYGYDAEWAVVSACSLGAPHVRERVFVVAYPAGSAGGRHLWEWEHEAPGSGWWANEPGMGRVAYGIAGGLERRKALGNSIVPQAVEWIGRRIMKVS